MKSLCLLIILIASSLSSAFAVVGTPNEIFRPMAKQHIQMVLDHGVTHIKKLNLNKLLNEMDTVEWRTFDIGFLMGSGGNRITSIYMVEEKMVVINMLTLQNMVGKPVPVYGWALHESLGALGYSDENYELSSSISFIANSTREDLNDNLQSIGENFLLLARATTNRHYSGDGGSTVIGGGGDMALIEFKQKILSRYKKWVEARQLNLSQKEMSAGIRKITRINIEYDLKSEKYNSIDFHFNGEMIYVDTGGELRPGELYTDEYIDNVLDTLKDYLFN